jgi:hypothetical protein
MNIIGYHKAGLWLDAVGFFLNADRVGNLRREMEGVGRVRGS